MATFAEDVKENLKQSFVERFEENTGILGKTLQRRREEREREKEITKQLDVIGKQTERLKNRTSSLSAIEITLTQVSLNLQNILVSFGEAATLQSETEAAMAETKKQQEQEQQQFLSLRKQQEDVESDDEESDSLLDTLAQLLGVFPFGKKKPPRKPPKSAKGRAKTAARKAYKAAQKKGLSRDAAKKAAREAQNKAIQRAAKQQAAEAAKKAAALAAEKAAREKAIKEAAEKAAKEAAEKAAREKLAKEAAEKAAKEAAEKAAKEAAERAAKELQKKAAKETVKKLALTKLGSTVGKIGAKSIPFVGAAVGVGFAAWKLVQGDYVGAGVEAVSGLGSAVTAIPATIYSTARDIYYETYEAWPESDAKQSERWPALYQTVKEAAEELLGKKIDVQTPQPEKKPTPAATPLPAQVPAAQQPQQSPIQPPTTVAAAPAIAAGAPTAAAAVTPSQPPTAGMSGMAGRLAAALEEFGITNPIAKQAIIATAAKESGLDPTSKEAGAAAYIKTLASRGLDYIYKVFPQLKPGGRVSKALGFTQTGVPKEVIEKEWSKGDEAFFEMVYGGLSTNKQAGDGYRYRGRGFVQITGRSVYENVGKQVGLDLVSNPDLVSSDVRGATAALAGYLFMSRGGKQKALQTMNSFTDPTEALRWTLHTVAGLGNKISDFEKEGTHLHHQLEKASKFMNLAAGGVRAQSAPTTGSDVQTTTVAVNNMKQQQKQGNDVTVVSVEEKQTVYKPARQGARTETMRAVG